MGNGLQFQRLCCVRSVKLLSIFGIALAVAALLSQLLALPYENYISVLSNVGSSTIWPEKRLFANSTIGFHLNISIYSIQGEIRNQSAQLLQLKLPAAPPIGEESVISDTGNSISSDVAKMSVPFNNKVLMKNLTMGANSDLLRAAGASIMQSKRRRRPTSISYMNSLVLQNSVSLVRSQWHSARELELRNAKFQIENSPIIRNVPEVHASIFRNYSKFTRSYELMERLLKVYVYREGEKPIFHQLYQRVL